ncbi:hypothetical protein QVD17_20535 [Tagetes erecta]|uniref:Uncharacterized protein n=1 Tax=Tagetes erecta TaxID=13708 RepID=A0AAD8KLD8_TARER|nr:hypothetical protein QVD17_20535 [Tagetes erecta]
MIYKTTQARTCEAVKVEETIRGKRNIMKKRREDLEEFARDEDNIQLTIYKGKLEAEALMKTLPRRKFKTMKEMLGVQYLQQDTT